MHFKSNLVDSFGGTTNDYVVAVTNIIKFLKTQRINVGGITSDNCRAQVESIPQRSEKSFQFVSTNPEDKEIIWISCICHVLALGVKHFFEEPQIHPMISEFKEVVAVLRKNQ